MAFISSQASSREKNFQQIVSELAHAINLQPDNARYHFHLGLAYHRLGKLDKAVSAYRKACQLQPHERYRLHLILAYLKKNEPQQAEENLACFPEGFYKNLLETALDLLKKQSSGELKAGADTMPLERDLFIGLLLLIDGKPHEAASRFAQALHSSGTNRHSPAPAQSILFYYLGLAQRAASPDELEAWEKAWTQALNAGWLNAGIAKPAANENLFIMLWEQGMKLAGAGKYAPASLAWERALKIKPRHQALRDNLQRLKFLMGNEAARRGDFNAALALWQSLPRQNDIDLFHNIALAYDQLQKPREANSHWTEVIKFWKREYRTDADKNRLKDHLMIAHKHLAQNYAKLGELRSAIRELQEVLHYDPHAVECHQQLGDWHAEMENWPQARREFEAVLRNRPNDVDASLGLAFALEMCDEMEQARATLENVLKSEPHHAPAKKQLGGLLHEHAHERWDEGEYEAAAGLFKQQIELDPSNFEGYKCLAGLLFEDEQTSAKDAEAVLQNYIAVRSGSPAAHVEVGVTYLQADDRRQAEKYFKQAEQIGVTDPALLIEIGKAYLPISESKARKYFDRAANAAPRDAKLCAQIGSILGFEHPAFSLEYLQRSLKIDGSNAEVYAEMGMVQNLLGNRREAGKAWFMAKQLAGRQGNQDLVKTVTEMQKTLNELQGIFGFLRDL